MTIGDFTDRGKSLSKNLTEALELSMSPTFRGQKNTLKTIKLNDF